jgi:thioredoxin reductase
MKRSDVDVLVVGGGPAGLAAAVELRRAGIPRVRVVDRDREIGGVPRHCHHTGFGLLDMASCLSGPAYARERRDRARDAGATLSPETTATAWLGPTALGLTGPDGLEEVSARAVLLATGCRERPRAARLVSGSRPAGVFTTGSLQQLFYLHGVRVGRRAVVVGAEHVSFSAAHTLSSAGVDVAALVTDLDDHQTVPLFRFAIATLGRIPLLVRTRLTRILGHRRVEGVEVRSADDEARVIPCDTVVFTGDWIPEHELACLGGIGIDKGTLGPVVDAALRSSVPGVFVAGNLLRGAETADVAAIEGQAAAGAIHRYLREGVWHEQASSAQLHVEPPLAWICPNVITSPPLAPPRQRFVLRSARFVDSARLEVRQGTRLLHAQRAGRLVPNRPIALAASWLERAIVPSPERVVVRVA